MNRKTVALYGIAGVLCLVVAVFAVLTTPDLSPAMVVYHNDGNSADTGTTVTVTEATESPTAAASTTAPQTVPGKVNINTATKEELMTLDGIGEVLAEHILAYRNQYGGFDSLEELMQVSGIGEKRFAAIQPYITL